MRKSDISKMSPIAVEFGNATHVVTPKSCLNKRIWLLTQDSYNDLREQIDFLKEQLRSKRRDGNDEDCKRVKAIHEVTADGA